MGKKIMVVDDDAMNLKMAGFILGKENYEIICVDSGSACMEKLQEVDVDLVLLDIEMPGLSGIETMQEIRKQSKYSDLKVMFLSASDAEEVETQMETLHVCGHVKKPFKPQELLTAVADVL